MKPEELKRVFIACLLLTSAASYSNQFCGKSSGARRVGRQFFLNHGCRETARLHVSVKMSS